MAHEMSTAELLGIAEGSRWTQIADELVTRTAPDDVELLRRRGERSPDLPMRRAAILALGRQGRRELLAIAERTTARPSAARCRARSRSRSRRCRCRRRARSRTTGWRRATGRGGARPPACSRRGPRTRTSSRRGARWRASSTAASTATSTSSARSRRRSAAAPSHGPFDELLRAYEEIPYSYGRRYVVAALAASDPTFARRRRRRVPVGLRAETRRLAASHVDRRVRLAAQRLDELAGDRAQAASVRAAAVQRLRG